MRTGGLFTIRAHLETYRPHALAFFYPWVYNSTQSVLLCMLPHGGTFNAAMRVLPASLAVLQREIYVALLAAQVVTPLLAVAILALATGGGLGYAAALGRNDTDTLED